MSNNIAQQTHFIFGYGSLISKASRALTGLTGVSYPVEVQGIQRTWNVAVKESGLTAVGIQQKPGAVCNGVVFTVEADQLPYFDEREKGYDRLELPAQAIRFYRDQPSEVGRYWAYFGQDLRENFAYPIARTYVDVILHGCLDISETFARDFINTTAAWRPLLDDREQPRYPRAMPTDPDNAQKMQQLLARWAGI